MNSKITKNYSWWEDIKEKVYINAIFKNGEFVDIQTGKPIVLKDNTAVRIIASIYGIKEAEQNKHREITKNLLLKSGSELNFHFYYKDKGYEFKVVLIEDLYYRKKGNQFSRLEPCKCIVVLSGTEEKITADSLNQAFIRASIKYRPDNRTHTCNVFKTFYYYGRQLEELRDL